MKKKQNKFYIYVYLDPRKSGHYSYNNICFLYEPIYAGKGCGKRYLEHLVYTRYTNKHLKNKLVEILQEFTKKDVEKYILIVRYNLTEKEAFDLEIKLIKEIGRSNFNLGPLVNFTNGGEGVSGWTPDSNWKKKQSDLNYQRWSSPEYKKRLSESHKNLRGKNHWMYGRIQTYKQKETSRQFMLTDKNPMKRSDVKIKFNGENNYLSKLNNREVTCIKMLIKLGFSDKYIQKYYSKVCESSIHNIRNNSTWKHIIV